MQRIRVLVIEDEEPMLENYRRMLDRMGYECIAEKDSLKALKNLNSYMPDVVIADLKMPGADGFEVLSSVKQLLQETPVILITAYANIPTAVDAVKKGAFDFISKPFTASQLQVVLDRAVRHKRLLEENRKLKKRLKLFNYDDIVFRSRPMAETMELVESVADKDVNVLITGESGTGKELIARTIHNHSSRSSRPFVVVDCTAIPENLLESELFGYEKGAFTGADRAKQGLFESANGGTLFLDEVGELPLFLQVKLLRTIQDKTLRRLGSNKSIKLDVRIIAATNRNLKEEVKKGLFREDLFYRLNVINIHIPPLRQRKEDIALIAVYFLKVFSEHHNKSVSTISPEAMQMLETYNWPGNVRELKNVIERAVVLANSDTIQMNLLPKEFMKSRVPEEKSELLPYKKAKERYILQFEKQYLSLLLEKTKGNITKAAEIAGINRRTIHRLINRYGINRDRKDTIVT